MKIILLHIIDDIDDTEYVEIDVENTGETELSVWFDDGDKKFNVPKSLMKEWPDEGDTGTAVIAFWFAKREELI